ncbi:MAG: MarR family EPS-associated transcriptional regulator [Gammaproteobacteria bacterium]|nr:MarR family EPS-associated transcriptional regulator [Gammaproteobacteria bacterium]|tara:strand:- start:3083 stop:3409 length:327 start_codon:yes stop_codon:yes gene_type:complete
MLTDDARYKILKTLEANPDISQRQLASTLGISLGKVNYCLQALIEKGLIKAKNFSKSPYKGRYLYILTPKGIDNKARLTRRFLQRKQAEYEALRAEIEEIRRELGVGE